MASNNKKNGNSTGAVGMGVGLTAAAVAAAGAYFLYGSKNAAKNRKAVKSWGLRAKAEVLEGLEAAKHMTQEEYEALVDAVAQAKKGIKSVSKADLAEFAKEMKDNWKVIAKGAGAAIATKKAVTKQKQMKKAKATPKPKTAAKKPKTSTPSA